jgi:hypothetical protein
MDALWDSGDWNNEKNGNDVIQTLLNAPSVELIEAFFQIRSDQWSSIRTISKFNCQHANLLSLLLHSRTCQNNF